MSKRGVVVVSLLVIISAFAVAIVVFTINPQKETASKDVVLSVGTSTFVTLSNTENFEHIDIVSWNYTSSKKERPKMIFVKNDGEGESTEVVYDQPYYTDIIQKGNNRVVRIFTPDTFYQDGNQIDTSHMEVKVYTSSANYQTQNYNTQSGDDFEYLIITNETLWQTINDNFKDWKVEDDAKITNISIVNISSITGNSSFWVNGTYGDATNTTAGNHWITDGEEVTSSYNIFNDTQAKIRNYLRWCYDTKATRYVMLLGNKDIVPPRMVCSYATGDGGATWDNDLSHASDMYYACLHNCMNNNTNSYWMENKCYDYTWDDIDWGYELCVGRVPVDTIIELSLWINKTKAYSDGIYQGEYLANHIVACKSSGGSISSQTWDSIGDEFKEHRGNQTFLNNQNISSIQWNDLNFYVNGDRSGWEDGFQLIHHAGHGGTLWSPYSSSNCDNKNIPQFVYTEGCHSADFGTDTSSRMESWISDDGCAFAGISNSAYGWFVASTYYGEEMFDQMFNESNTLIFCKAHNDAREIYGHQEDSVFGMVVKETNFFGDPAIEYQPYLGEPCQFISIDGGLNGTTVYDRTPIFNWTEALNTSWYWLQVSTDIGFSNLIVNITDINEVNYPAHYFVNNARASFTLPNVYALPDSNAIYYCRVIPFLRGDV